MKESFASFLIDSNVFQLIGMLICIGVVVYLFVHNYAKAKEEDKDLKVQKLHTFYISGILVFIIIELITSMCMGDDNHPEILSYVSFAATLSSLIMSVVAIIFTIVTSNRGDEQYKKLDNVSDRVADSLSSFSDKTSDIDQSIESFKSISNTLTADISSLLAEVREMKKATYERIDQVSQQIQEINIKTIDNKPDEAYEELILRLITIGSFSGNIALYACVLSKEKNRSFKMSEITENVEDSYYKFGYLISSCAIGAITGQISPDVCSIQDCYPGLKDMLENQINVFIGNSNPAVKEINQKAFDRIKNLFK